MYKLIECNRTNDVRWNKMQDGRFKTKNFGTAILPF